MATRKRVEILLVARDEASRVIDKLATGGIPRLAKSIGGLAAGYASIGGAVDILKKAVANAIEAERATNALTQAVRAQGQDVARVVPHLTKYAEALSQAALASDEAIMGAQKTLVSVGGLSGKALDAATRSALDLSAGMGIELTEAATMVAKAAQGTVTAFSRLGAEFREGSTDAEKFEAATRWITARFGGAAAAEIETTAGAIHELNEAVGELLETLGQSALGGKGGINALTGGIRALTGSAPGFVGGGGGVSTGLAMLLPGILNQAAIGNANAAAMTEAAMDRIAAQRLPLLPGIAGPDPTRERQTDEFFDKLQDDLKKTKRDAEAAAESLTQFSNRAIALPFPARTGPQPFDSGIQEGDPLGESSVKLDEMNRLLQGGVDVLEQFRHEITETGEEIEVITVKAASFQSAIEEALDVAGVNAALSFSDTLIDAAFGAEIAWDKFFRSLMADLAKAIARAAILKALESTGFAFFSGGGIAASSTGIATEIPLSPLSSGGIVPSYAAAGLFASRGTDTVPAMLTPGEAVLSRQHTREILGGRAALVAAEGAGGSLTVPVHIGGAHLTTLLIRNSRSVEQVNEYIDRRR